MLWKNNLGELLFSPAKTVWYSQKLLLYTRYFRSLFHAKLYYLLIVRYNIVLMAYYLQNTS